MSKHVAKHIEILQRFRMGLIPKSEALKQLDAIKIRGDFGVTGFVGYDYENQCWVKVIIE